ncbi:hypothetical protein BC827DRAFT_1386389 [Russula dissimulans]|nr:hypothetical protein BC827DRAFT_1386389 [Russula dissimulans]
MKKMRRVLTNIMIAVVYKLGKWGLLIHPAGGPIGVRRENLMKCAWTSASAIRSYRPDEYNYKFLQVYIKIAEAHKKTKAYEKADRLTREFHRDQVRSSSREQQERETEFEGPARGVARERERSCARVREELCESARGAAREHEREIHRGK